MKSVLIIGYGVIGKLLAVDISALKPDIYDKFIPENNTKDLGKKYDIAFICVPTPYVNNENVCDISEVRIALAENEADLYVIKSTVLPGTTDKLVEETGKRIVFSPEYYGATQHCNNFDFAFTTVGGNRRDCKEVVQLLQKVYDARHRFNITDTKTAELAKYMDNAYLATKVSFCVQFWEIAQKIGVDYEALRELFIADPRVNPSHTFVYEETPYWDSHCLNKDVPAIAEAYDANLLKAVIGYNGKVKENKK